MQNLNALLKRLLDHNLEFVIVGGFAATLHGSSIVTKDLDICVPLSSDYIEKLRNCLKEIHPVHRMHPKKLSFLEFPEDTATTKNIYLKTDEGILDILGFVGGVGKFDDLKKNAIEISLFDHKCHVISIDDLISAKATMGSPKDLSTIEELKIIKSKI